MSPSRRVSIRGALGAYALIVLGAAVLPGGALGTVAPDKFLHAAAYGAMAALSLWARVPSRGGVAAAVAVCVAHGAAVEGLQAVIPWRRAEWGDLAADAIGALAAGTFWTIVARVRRRARFGTGGEEA